MELSGGGKQRSLGNRTSFPIALGVFPECLRFQLPCPGLEGRATDCVPWSAQADAVSTARERTHARTHTHYAFRSAAERTAGATCNTRTNIKTHYCYPHSVLMCSAPHHLRNEQCLLLWNRFTFVMENVYSAVRTEFVPHSAHTI